MQKIKASLVCLLIATLVIMLPVCFAEEIKATDGVTFKDNGDLSKGNKRIKESAAAPLINIFPGLASLIATMIYGAGIVYIAIGAAVIVGGYLVYHIGKTAWTYYTAYSYTKLIEYKHINQFPNIWRSPPSKKDFEKKCKDNMNSKSVERYLQIADGRSIAYNPSTKMLTVGDTNGKDIITCFPKDRKDVNNEVSKGRWKRIK